MLKTLSTPQANSSTLVYELGAIQHPSQLFPAFQGMSHPVFLDSAMPGTYGKQFSYLTADPFLVARSRGRRITLEHEGICEDIEGDPWLVIQDLLRRYHVRQIPELPSFQGGVLGYWGYDLGRHLEKFPSWADDDLQLPEMYLGFYDWALAYDGHTGNTLLFSTGLPMGTAKRAQVRIDQVMARIADRKLAVDIPRFYTSEHMESNFTSNTYRTAVERIKSYLSSGDSYQVNLSQRFHARFNGDPWGLYLKLRNFNPAPFGAYIGFPEVTVLSASPEEFLSLENGRVRARPIKGTRPVGVTPDETDRYSIELLESEKELAENIMIVDLIRNDLGRVCKIGSVEVPSLFNVEQHPTVLHLVSTITGDLLPSKNAIDLLKACFPGGSVTGAPKLRSMEIIEELEPVRRGIYCGAIGYISFGGHMCTSIAIRTMVLTKGNVYLHLGGGIVADSDPLAEYQETLQKGMGLRRSLDLDD